MASATVRRWRDAWIVDVSTVVDGKRKRQIKSFGAGAKAKAAAEAYCREVAPEAKAGRFWERQTATFADLWDKFAAHELIGPTPGPATIVDYRGCARLYLLPHLGTRLLTEIDAQPVMSLKASLLTEAGAKASGKEGSRKPLSPRTVAKILRLLGTVCRYGKRIGLLADNPVADVKKPKAAKKPVYILEPEESHACVPHSTFRMSDYWSSWRSLPG